jgi:superfamily II DNA or RNA helicase
LGLCGLHHFPPRKSPDRLPADTKENHQMPDAAKDVRKAYYAEYGSRVTQDSERLFIDEFLFPLLGEKLLQIVPQCPFLDSTGRSRRIDFVYAGNNVKLALEVNGETYHAEGIIPNEMFDDNLFRQNEILSNGYKLIRFSYSQLQSPKWRPLVMQSLRSLVTDFAPELLGENPIKPNSIQKRALEALDFYRSQKGWQKGLVVLPTGTGKTILSALDVKRMGGRALFFVHRLDILSQSVEAYRKVWPKLSVGKLTGDVKDNEYNCDVLFASKDSLRQPGTLATYKPNWFDYIVVDEVHHGQSLSYKDILAYFTPQFMLGMTATPDRLDRKDIFELFDYQKIYEVTLQEAIDDGYLVPYDYYGLTDDVDYSKIRYQGNRYNTADLEKLLIVPARNEAILREYIDKGGGDKAIGFCVSIKHAERMAELFRNNGITAEAITSGTPNRDTLIERFRDNQINAVFTVDLFNEGMDFPNVRVLLFLRPTESKTVFTQQLGRGLRLCTGKERVKILDFIGNYKRANQIRKWLSKSERDVVKGEGKDRKKKREYTYSTGCAVHFDARVEEILDSQDEHEIEVTREDLKEAYFELAETLGHKPSREELNTKGRYKIAQYLKLFDSWADFLFSIGEYTEASYHYPQGVHLGHLLSILKVFGVASRKNTHFDDRYIRLRGGFDKENERLASYQRQVKYKLQAAMELGILPDDRSYGSKEEVPMTLTPAGKQLHDALKPLLDKLDLKFPRDEKGIPSSNMALGAKEYSAAVREFLEKHSKARQISVKAFLRMPAVCQMLLYFYHVSRAKVVKRATVYKQFFKTPFVTEFCDQEGIEPATEEASRHRCPFLINILDACDLVEQNEEITVKRLLICTPTVRLGNVEKSEEAQLRAKRISEALSTKTAPSAEDASLLREAFGKEFLTDAYYLKEWEYIEV